jgi:hypothetical protein
LEERLKGATQEDRIPIAIRCAIDPKYRSEVRAAFATGRGTATAITHAIGAIHQTTIAPVTEYLSQHNIPYREDPRWYNTLLADATRAQTELLQGCEHITYLVLDERPLPPAGGIH